MEAKLVVIGGKANMGEVMLRLPMTIGRGHKADLMISHPTVSREHCKLFEVNGELVVKDNGSSNGTFVDGEKIADQTVVHPGQILAIGPLTFRAEYDAPTARAFDGSTEGGLADTQAIDKDELDIDFLLDDEPAPKPAAAKPKVEKKPVEAKAPPAAPQKPVEKSAAAKDKKSESKPVKAAPAVPAAPANKSVKETAEIDLDFLLDDIAAEQKLSPAGRDTSEIDLGDLGLDEPASSPAAKKNGNEPKLRTVPSEETEQTVDFSASAQPEALEEAPAAKDKQAEIDFDFLSELEEAEPQGASKESPPFFVEPAVAPVTPAPAPTPLEPAIVDGSTVEKADLEPNFDAFDFDEPQAAGPTFDLPAVSAATAAPTTESPAPTTPATIDDELDLDAFLNVSESPAPEAVVPEEVRAAVEGQSTEPTADAEPVAAEEDSDLDAFLNNLDVPAVDAPAVPHTAAAELESASALIDFSILEDTREVETVAKAEQPSAVTEVRGDETPSIIPDVTSDVDAAAEEVSFDFLDDNPEPVTAASIEPPFAEPPAPAVIDEPVAEELAFDFLREEAPSAAPEAATETAAMLEEPAAPQSEVQAPVEAPSASIEESRAEADFSFLDDLTAEAPPAESTLEDFASEPKLEALNEPIAEAAPSDESAAEIEITEFAFEAAAEQPLPSETTNAGTTDSATTDAGLLEAAPSEAIVNEAPASEPAPAPEESPVSAAAAAADFDFLAELETSPTSAASEQVGPEFSLNELQESVAEVSAAEALPTELAAAEAPAEDAAFDFLSMSSTETSSAEPKFDEPATDAATAWKTAEEAEPDFSFGESLSVSAPSGEPVEPEQPAFTSAEAAAEPEAAAAPVIGALPVTAKSSPTKNAPKTSIFDKIKLLFSGSKKQAAKAAPKTSRKSTAPAPAAWKPPAPTMPVAPIDAPIPLDDAPIPLDDAPPVSLFPGEPSVPQEEFATSADSGTAAEAIGGFLETEQTEPAPDAPALSIEPVAASSEPIAADAVPEVAGESIESFFEVDQIEVDQISDVPGPAPVAEAPAEKLEQDVAGADEFFLSLDVAAEPTTESLVEEIKPAEAAAEIDLDFDALTSDAPSITEATNESIDAQAAPESLGKSETDESEAKGAFGDETPASEIAFELETPAQEWSSPAESPPAADAPPAGVVAEQASPAAPLPAPGPRRPHLVDVDLRLTSSLRTFTRLAVQRPHVDVPAMEPEEPSGRNFTPRPKTRSDAAPPAAAQDAAPALPEFAIETEASAPSAEIPSANATAPSDASSADVMAGDSPSPHTDATEADFDFLSALDEPMSSPEAAAGEAPPPTTLDLVSQEEEEEFFAVLDEPEPVPPAASTAADDPGATTAADIAEAEQPLELSLPAEPASTAGLQVASDEIDLGFLDLELTPDAAEAALSSPENSEPETDAQVGGETEKPRQPANPVGAAKQAADQDAELSDFFRDLGIN